MISMFMENLSEIITWFGSVLALLIIILTLLYKLTGSKKLLKIKEFLESLNYKTIHYIEQAEEFEDKKGSEKKSWVINKLKELSKNVGIEIDDIFIDNLIERMIEFSKKVNAR